METDEEKVFDKAKKEYEALLDTGMFWEFFPDYSGEWEKDNDKFLKFYKNREKFNKNAEV